MCAVRPVHSTDAAVRDVVVVAVVVVVVVIGVSVLLVRERGAVSRVYCVFTNASWYRRSDTDLVLRGRRLGHWSLSLA